MGTMSSLLSSSMVDALNLILIRKRRRKIKAVWTLLPAARRREEGVNRPIIAVLKSGYMEAPYDNGTFP